ncbi:MAG: hypothetical protein PVI30_18075 [Myxococcales bacterium]
MTMRVGAFFLVSALLACSSGPDAPGNDGSGFQTGTLDTGPGQQGAGTGDTSTTPGAMTTAPGDTAPAGPGSPTGGATGMGGGAAGAAAPVTDGTDTTGATDGTDGTDTTGTTDGTVDGGDGEATTPEDTAARPPCITDPSQVIVMGDSYVNWVSHTFPQDLASSFGNGAQGVWDVPYNAGGRLYAIGGWAMGSGGIGLIPDQLDFAIADDPDIRAVVMTGGGNDFLVSSPEWPGGGECRNDPNTPPQQVCQDIVHTAFDAARQLMQDSADAGVEDVVYFFYPNIPAPTLLGGTYPNVLLDWSYPQVKELCDDTEMDTGGRMRCHFLDLRPLFEGHPEYFVVGDVHENAMGSACRRRPARRAPRRRHRPARSARASRCSGRARCSAARTARGRAPSGG